MLLIDVSFAKKSGLTMQSIAEFFSCNNISDFIFAPTTGNAGDALINAASVQVFEQAGLNYQLMSPRAL